jgi:hypothetical protein
MKTLKTKTFEFNMKLHTGLININFNGTSINQKEGEEKKKFTEESEVKALEQSVSDCNVHGQQSYSPSEIPDDEVTIVYEKYSIRTATATSSKTLVEDATWENYGEDGGEEIEIINQINEKGVPCSFGEGELSHRFHFKNVYGSQLDRRDHCENIATTKQIGWVCVDYIFYSTIWSHRYQKPIEGNLKLIRRYGLLNRQQCKKMGCMPNSNVSSDHFPLIAEFLLKP